MVARLFPPLMISFFFSFFRALFLSFFFYRAKQNTDSTKIGEIRFQKKTATWTPRIHALLFLLLLLLLLRHWLLLHSVPHLISIRLLNKPETESRAQARQGVSASTDIDQQADDAPKIVGKRENQGTKR